MVDLDQEDKRGTRFPQWRYQLSIAAAFVLLLALSSLTQDLRNLIYSVDLPIVKFSKDYAQQQVDEYMIPSQASNETTYKVESSIRNGSNESSLEISPLANCSVTSQVKIRATLPHWTLETYDQFGNRKTVGGDEFYITYRDESKYLKSTDTWRSLYTAVAVVKDQQDGSYLLDFVTPPFEPDGGNLTGIGNLTVHFVYSCNIGHVTPPRKTKWNDSGATRAEYTVAITAQPPLRRFQAPRRVDLSNYRKVIAYGDSLICQFVGDCQMDSNETKFFLPNRVTYKQNTHSQFDTWELEKLFNQLEAWHGDELRIPGTALLTGSSVWDVIFDDKGEVDFKDHFAAVRTFVLTVQGKYPNTTIIWKSPSALHFHVIANSCANYCNEVTKYMSNSRMKVLYQGQKKLMQELGVQFLDVHYAYYLSSDHTLGKDGRHFNEALNALVLGYFFDKDKAATAALSRVISDYKQKLWREWNNLGFLES